MRLVTFRADDGTTRLGAVVGDQVIDLAAASGGALPSEMVAFIEAGPAALARAGDLLQGGPAGVPLSGVTLLAPIPRPRRNVFCLGLNYRAHAAEAQQFGVAQKDPEYPIFFSKPPSSVVGPDSPIEVNTDVTKEVDWEVEMTVVIGPGGHDIPKDAVMEPPEFLQHGDVVECEVERIGLLRNPVQARGGR